MVDDLACIVLDAVDERRLATTQHRQAERVEAGRFGDHAALVPQQWQLLDVARAADRRAEVINGSVAPKLAAEIDAAFRGSELDTIIGNPQVADVGWNWQFCGTSEVSDIFYVSMDYQDTAFFQSYKRAMRQARRTALRIKIYTYIDSVDQHIMRLTKRKSVEAAQVERGRVPLPF